MCGLVRLYLQNLKTLTKNSFDSILKSTNFSKIFEIEIIIDVFKNEHANQVTDNEIMMLGMT